jgi:hypothetical protein
MGRFTDPHNIGIEAPTAQQQRNSSTQLGTRDESWSLSASEPKKLTVRSRREQRFFAGRLGRTLQDCGSSTAVALKSQHLSAWDVSGGIATFC